MLLDRLLEVLSEHQVRWERVSSDAPTIQGGCAVVLSGVDADELCQRLQYSIFLSTSSACSSGQIKISHVLSSMGLSHARGKSVIRLMVDSDTTVAAIEAAGRAIASAATKR
jgi:cysteine desulfurase